MASTNSPVLKDVSNLDMVAKKLASAFAADMTTHFTSNKRFLRQSFIPIGPFLVTLGLNMESLRRMMKNRTVSKELNEKLIELLNEVVSQIERLRADIQSSKSVLFKNRSVKVLHGHVFSTPHQCTMDVEIAINRLRESYDILRNWVSESRQLVQELANSPIKASL
jgi:hypothetical protein